jgi:hypothetical protein
MDLSTDLGTSQVADDNRLSTDLGAGGTETTEATPAKVPVKESRMDALKRATADVAPKESKEPAVKQETTDKGAEEGKAEPEAKESAKAEETPAETAPKQERARRQPIEAPAKFMPRAKELWTNTPHEVRVEMQRVMAEAETEANSARESSKQYEALKPYAEMAERSGTTIDQAMSRYVQMEQTLRNNPSEGFRALATNMGMTPVQVIGHVMAAYGVRPEQLAQHMMQSPNDYTALAARPQASSQHQPNNEVMQLRQQMAQMQQSMQHNQLQATVIEPFARENPRYHELEGTIAQFLQSDIIPKALGPSDRLAAAYDMAVRISSQVKAQPAIQQNSQDSADSRADTDFGGKLSVRGAPASGVETTNVRKGKLSRGDSIKRAMADLGLAN